MGIPWEGLAFVTRIGSIFDFCIAMEGRDLEHVGYPMETTFQDVGVKT